MNETNITDTLHQIELSLREIDSAKDMVESTVSSYDAVKLEVKRYSSLLEDISQHLQSLSNDTETKNQTLIASVNEKVTSSLNQLTTSADNYTNSIVGVQTRCTEEISKTTQSFVNSSENLIKNFSQTSETILGTLGEKSKVLNESITILSVDLKHLDANNVIKSIESKSQLLQDSIENQQKRLKNIQISVDNIPFERLSSKIGFVNIALDSIKSESQALTKTIENQQSNYLEVCKEKSEKNLVKTILALQKITALNALLETQQNNIQAVQSSVENISFDEIKSSILTLENHLKQEITPLKETIKALEQKAEALQKGFNAQEKLNQTLLEHSNENKEKLQKLQSITEELVSHHQENHEAMQHFKKHIYTFVMIPLFLVLCLVAFIFIVTFFFVLK